MGINMINTQKTLPVVLARMIQLVNEDEYFAEMLADELEPWLDCLASDDFFGTERQCDPRGDMRVREWSIWGEVQ